MKAGIAVYGGPMILEKSGLNWTATFATGQATDKDRCRAIVLAALEGKQ